MYPRTIHKPAVLRGTPHHLIDYEAARRAFTWEHARLALTGTTDAHLNMAHEALDRRVEHGCGPRLAARFIGRNGTPFDVTYARLRTLACRFANVLEQLGGGRGSTVATVLERVPELFVVALGTLKAARVFCPLFCSLGPEPLGTRLQLGHVQVLVTTASVYRRSVAPLRASLPELRHVIVVSETADEPVPSDTANFSVLMSQAGDEYATAPTHDADTALLHFTSGTSGRPKGVTLPHGAVIAQHATSELVLDLHGREVFWCTADPAWVPGIAYGLIGPLTCGVTVIVDQAPFDPLRCYRILERQRVNVWYTTPTAIRTLMHAGLELAGAHEYPSLRHIASLGEPLGADALAWGMRAFGLALHDTWGQSETGAIMIANFPACDIATGSMGRAIPGIEATVLRRTAEGGIELIDSPEEVGEVALRSGWPSMFSAYLDEAQDYRQRFREGWYLAGDLARRDRDGHFWFIGRADDVIKSAGSVISPFEVENALLRHPAVAQAAVIGIPDPIGGEAVKAFVELADGFLADEALQRDLLAHGPRVLGSRGAPREIVFGSRVPRAHNGQIMRRLLRAREFGLAEGDRSTLADRE